MPSVNRHFFAWAGIALALALWAMPSPGFSTGTPLSLTIEPSTIRQKGGKEIAKVIATVLLKDPSPAYFTCVLRSADGAKVSFPTIIFHKGDQKATSEGVVHWKDVRRETRLRISAYNADAPDQRLTFTITLMPAEDVTRDPR